MPLPPPARQPFLGDGGDSGDDGAEKRGERAQEEQRDPLGGYHHRHQRSLRMMEDGTLEGIQQHRRVDVGESHDETRRADDIGGGEGRGGDIDPGFSVISHASAPDLLTGLREAVALLYNVTGQVRVGGPGDGCPSAEAVHVL